MIEPTEPRMFKKVPCPSCGRSLMVPEDDAGLPVLCNACGQRLTVPASESPFTEATAMALEPASSDAPPASPAPRFDPTDRRFAWLNNASATPPPAAPVNPLASATESPDAEWPRTPEPVPRPWLRRTLDDMDATRWTLFGAAVACAMMLLGVVVLVAVRVDQNAKRQQAAAGGDAVVASMEVMAKIDRADQLAIDGDLRGAHKLYAEAEAAANKLDPAAAALLANELAHARQRHRAVVTAMARQSRDPQNVFSFAATRPHPATVAAVDPTADDPAEVMHGAVSPTKPPSSAPVAVAVPSPRPPPPPPTKPEPEPKLHVAPQSPPTGALTDEQIGASIQRGANWLLNRIDPNRHELIATHQGDNADEQHDDLNALVVYALLQCGQALPGEARLDPRKPFMADLLTKLAAANLDAKGHQHAETYGRGLRATALAAVNRKPDQAALRADAAWLIKTTKRGAWGYGDDLESTQWDNSNSQYGVLGIWSAAEAGVPIDGPVWKQIESHWESNQNPDGSWNYREPGGSGTVTMTCAGLASLFVAHDYLDAATASADRLGQPDYPPAIKRALDWIDAHNQQLYPQGGYWGYQLYSIERVGLAGGLKFFGDFDWYREIARQVIERQQPDGAWGNDNEVDAAYALLFLSRGRHPILMNKVRFDGHWANRSHDLSYLARYASHQLEQPLNWQVVSIDARWQDWTDSPILYLAADAAPKLTDQQVDQVRRYVENGGLLFTHADGASPAFNDFAADLAKRLFPRYAPLRPLPADHEVYSVLYDVDPKLIPLSFVTNGVRPLMLHSPGDIAKSWQKRDPKKYANEFQLGVNLFVYASGKGSVRNRLASTIVSEPRPPTGGTARVARLRYGDEHRGDWDPEPAAWPRAARWFGLQTNCWLDPVETDLASLNAASLAIAPMAHLTGSAPFNFSEADARAVRAYVDAGGTLLIDAAGGNAAFADCAAALLARAFPDANLSPLPPDHPLLQPTVRGMEDCSRPVVRPYALRKLGPHAGARSLETLPHGKGRVVYTALDLTSALIGTQSWGVAGYDPPYALSLIKNAAIWTASGCPEQRAAVAR